jgi:hypothetical protein
MSDIDNLFIEATTLNKQYTVLWRGINGMNDLGMALDILRQHDSPNRLELWSKAHAGTDKGFAPMAYREANSRTVRISNTLKMLAGL